MDCLLDGHRGAGALEGCLGLVGGLLGHLLQDRLRGAVHQVLGLLETEAGERAHLLDDLDLLVAGGLEDDVELVLPGLLLCATGGTAGCGGGSGGDRGGRGDAEGVLELLHELRELDEGHLLERLKELVGAELRHGGGSFLLWSGGGGGPISPRWSPRRLPRWWCSPRRQPRDWAPRPRPRARLQPTLSSGRLRLPLAGHWGPARPSAAAPR